VWCGCEFALSPAASPSSTKAHRNRRGPASFLYLRVPPTVTLLCLDCELFLVSMRGKQHYALSVCSRDGCSQRIIVSLSSSQRATCPTCGNRTPLKILTAPEHLLLSLDNLPMLRAMAGPPWASVLPGKPFWVWDRKCGNIPPLNFSFQQLTPGALRARVDDCSLEELPGLVHRYLLLLDCDGHAWSVVLP